jgi:hypothetical protein
MPEAESASGIKVDYNADDRQSASVLFDEQALLTITHDTDKHFQDEPGRGGPARPFSILSTIHSPVKCFPHRSRVDQRNSRTACQSIQVDMKAFRL